MKIRTDFVTNSSSSSFVIGKKDDESVTIESVYQMLRVFYKEMYSVTIPKNDGWLQCETYEDYIKYWKASDKFAPFTIVDFLEDKEVEWVHWKGKEIHKVDTENDTLQWFYPYIDKSGDCDVCEYRGWCDEEECKENQKLLFPKDKACLYLLGRVCVCSECGYIPDCVVEKLGDISEYWCNHMG